MYVGGIFQLKRLLLLMALIGLSSCSHPEKTTKEDYSSASISGYVTALQEGRFLVVDHQPRYQNDGDEYFDAIWFSSEESEGVEIGDYMYVWYGVSFLSYPGHAGATKFVVEEQEKQETMLTEKEVIQQAVNELDTITGEHYYSPILSKIEYEKQTNSWVVRFENKNLNKPDIAIHIKDAKS